MADDPTRDGEERVRAMIADAENPPAALGRLDAVDPITERAGVPAGEWHDLADKYGLPPDCPVIALGVDGGLYWFLDTLGQLRAIEDSKFGQKTIGSLFMGRHHFLYWAWPRKNKDGDIVSWRAEKAAEDLMGACAHKGPWNAVERARGRGAWRLADGRLAVHCGTQLFVDGRDIGLGELDGDVYMTRPAILKPWPRAMTNQEGPARQLLPLLRSWNWQRPDIDPILFMGWLACATIGGALPWRPVCYVTGDKATGKSTLQHLVRALYGAGLVRSADTTAAGIYQLLKNDSLPVAIDELEGKADSRKAAAIMELARICASGDLMLRGGESHKGVQFNARSCFLFSSINTPPLHPQDLSRMAMLRLKRLPAGSVSPLLNEQMLALLGRQLLRRMVDNWHRFTTTYQDYRAALAAGGHDSRGQDTFGTLLAGADLVIDVDAEKLGVPMGPMTADGLGYWTEKFQAIGMAEYEDAEENWRKCLNHLVSVPVDVWKDRARTTVGEVLADLQKPMGEGLSFVEAKRLLNKAGLSLATASPVPDTQNDTLLRLVIPNQHDGVQRLFHDQKWYGDKGAGVWAAALRQAPENFWTRENVRIHAWRGQCTAFPLDVVFAERVEDQAS